MAYKYKDEDARRGGFKALFITGGGGIALLVGLLIVGFVTGDTSFVTILGCGDLLRSSPLYPAMLVLIALMSVASIVGRALSGLGLGPVPGDFELVEAGTALAVVERPHLSAVPGFGEVHKHIESTHLTPEHEAALVLPRGNTWTCEASHELSNVCGPRNLEFWLTARAASTRSCSMRAGSWCFPTRP